VGTSFWDYTMRDYGNRVGIYRVLDTLDRLGLKATASMSSVVAERYPRLLRDILGAGWEIMAAGVDMKHLHHSGLAPEDEKAQVGTAVMGLRQKSGQNVLGWHSPGHAESAITPISWRPRAANTSPTGSTTTCPTRCRRRPAAAVDAADVRAFGQAGAVSAESVPGRMGTPGHRRFRVSLRGSRHGWRPHPVAVACALVIGQPYRIRALERVLAHVLAYAGVWSATGAEIAAHWRQEGGT